MSDEQGTEAFETMRVLLRDGASADQVRDRMEAAAEGEHIPLMLGAFFGLKESLDRFIADEESEREQSRKDRTAMRAAFSSLLELAERQVRLLEEMKTARNKVVIGRKPETPPPAGDPPAGAPPAGANPEPNRGTVQVQAQVRVQAPPPAQTRPPSPAATAAPPPAMAAAPTQATERLAEALAVPVAEAFMASLENRQATPQAPAPPPPQPETMTLADALPEGPALAAFFARELQGGESSEPDMSLSPVAAPPVFVDDEPEEEFFRPAPRRASIPQMIKPAAKPQEGDGPPPATLAAALARIVNDAAEEAEAHADDHPPLVLTEADIVEDEPLPARQSPEKSAAELSPKEIEALIASTLSQISGLTNR